MILSEGWLSKKNSLISMAIPNLDLYNFFPETYETGANTYLPIVKGLR